MINAMTDESKNLLADVLSGQQVRKFIITNDARGVPHLEENDSIHLDENGFIVLLETNEYSRTNLNLVRSIWFNHCVSVYLTSGDGTSVEVTGKPYKALVSGAVFEKYYKDILERSDSEALSTVWLIGPESVTNESRKTRKEREAKGRQPLVHLDRIAIHPS